MAWSVETLTEWLVERESGGIRRTQQKRQLRNDG